MLATSDNPWDLNEVNGWLKHGKTPLAGGFFPGVTAAQNKYQRNTIVVLSSKNPLRKCLVNGIRKFESLIVK
ncbi:MAG: hypothetical protein P8O79_13500 [Halieaceae bacterium]|nr:hypothetical protein [Halieaceae bacterium]